MATPTGKKFRVALDFHFVLLLESGVELYEQVFDELDRRKFEFIVTETPLQEIQDLSVKGSRPEFIHLGSRILQRFQSHYGIKTPGLERLQHGYADAIAVSLMEKSFLDDLSKDDALMIAEASIHNADFLIMADNTHLANVEGHLLNLALVEKGGNPITILCAGSVLPIFARLQEK